ncbi:conserved phage C-terminal domain-containing protein [Sporosarcina sp. 179-K 3D1 HS]|uniref:conserved phage C-terminal domain-containing protein n=1 Tax=Sporosarcina sp. 179-K 3D1 HS TaxID=3232169 RepID=UPI0039A0E8E9
MNLLINESPLLILPSLAKKVGLNESIILQQLHFRSLISHYAKDGYRWVCKTYEEWQEEFPFWSLDTIRRAIRKLETGGIVISTSAFNRMKMDKTKWYRIDYAKCSSPFGQSAPSMPAKPSHGEGQIALSEEGNLHSPITKELKNNKKDIVETRPDVVVEVIDYLNERTGKSFKTNSKSTGRMIGGRLSEGYTLDDFKSVIETKARQWSADPRMRHYLRPSTLFAPTNFENYLNEAPAREPERKQVHRAPVLDFGKGEVE